MKKLQVAVAAACLFAAGDAALAAAISQSGVTVAREVISRDAATLQTLVAPSVSFNYANGPTANAASTQDFSISLTLAGDGTPTWQAASLNAANIWKTINAKRQSNGSTYVVVGPASAAPAGGISYLRLLAVDQVPGVGATPTTNDTKVVRYYFRLENPTNAVVSLSDLAVEFNSVNVTTAPVLGDYARVATLQNSVNAIVGSTIGTGGTSADACGNADTRITVQARNFIGSGGTAPEGETAGLSIVNNGYILFAQALNIQVAKGIAINRTTDPTQSNQRLVASTLLYGAGPTPLGTTTSMPLGFLKFTNVPSLSAWDAQISGDYYAYGAPGTGNGPRLGDLGTANTTNIVGNVDVGTLVVTLTSTNGFAAGSTFSLTNNPFGTVGAAGAAGTDSGVAITAANRVLSTDGLTYTLTFTHADLVAAANTAAAQTLLGSTGANIAAGGGNAAYTASSDRFYLNYIVPGTSQIPLSSFSAVARLTKDDASEQTSVSCSGPLAGLGGGVKIDVRNFFPYSATNTEWVGVIRVINNDENVPADVTGQYIRADGAYGKFGSLGTLAPRAARYYTSKEIFDALTSNTTTAPVIDNTGSGGLAATGGEALPRNTRLRISSNAASTLRVQSYIYNNTTRSLVEVSASQGADFVNVEASGRDHIDQDAQTGIKR